MKLKALILALLLSTTACASITTHAVMSDRSNIPMEKELRISAVLVDAIITALFWNLTEGEESGIYK